jgi:hypothetical protein
MSLYLAGDGDESTITTAPATCLCEKKKTKEKKKAAFFPSITTSKEYISLLLEPAGSQDRDI